VTTTFEQGFAEVERSAAAAEKAASQVVKAARALQKAAHEGNIARVRQAAENLAAATDAARQDVANARTAWPFSEEEERAYLADGYEQELREEAERAGLTMYARDARLLAYPSILQILPAELAIKIDRARVAALRPAHLVRVLQASQKKKSRYPAQRFLESLYSAYKLIVPKEDAGMVIKLSQVYQALTLQPGASAEYSRSDFARDLFMLDQSGISQTSSGVRLSLPASTGTKGGGRDLFTFVAPTGEVQTYYGLRFTESDSR